MTEHASVEPDLDDVLQEPISATAILVRQDEPVRTHEVPTRSGGMLSTTLSTTTESIGGADRRRKRLVLLSLTESIYVGNTRQTVDSGAAMLWPKLVELEIGHSDQVFARCATADATTVLSVLVENWAD